MKRLTGFGDNSFMPIYFTFQSSSIAAAKARVHSSELSRACTGCRSMPLHRSVPTLRRIVFSRRIKFLLTATFVSGGLHC